MIGVDDDPARIPEIGSVQIFRREEGRCPAAQVEFPDHRRVFHQGQVRGHSLRMACKYSSSTLWLAVIFLLQPQ